MISKIFLVFLTSFLTQSCNKDDVTLNLNNNIEFSTSPIDLQGIEAKFVADMSYDNFSATKFDIFLPASTEPTGLVIYIHGGGFTGGDKQFIYPANSNYPSEIRTFLSNNIAVATINYRLLESNETVGVLKSLNDSKRALQYIRSRAEDFNIDKNKVVLGGNSAGAGTALWLATNNDFSDTTNQDVVLRESTRVKGVALRQTQSSYNIEDKWVNNVFVDYEVTWDDFLTLASGRIAQFYGVSSLSEYNTPEIDNYRKRIDMLSLLSSDDPEIWVKNITTPVVAPTNTGIAYHHAFHAREIKKFAENVGVPVVAYYGNNPVLFNDPSNETYVEFLIRKVNE